MKRNNIESKRKTQSKNYILSNYGKERENFLKNEKPELYNALKNSGKLDEHLIEVDLKACDMEAALVAKYSKAEGVTEEFKKTDMIKWVEETNLIKATVREFILNEFIFV